MRSPLQRLYQTKYQVVALVFMFVGFVLMVIGHWLGRISLDWWLQDVPVSGIGDGLFITGLLSVALSYIDREAGVARDTAHLEAVFDKKVPVLREAVYDSFASKPDALEALAPEVLDQLIRNALAVRLGDSALATDVYADVHAQIVRAVERHTDARAQLTLSPWTAPTGTGSDPSHQPSSQPDLHS